MQTLVRAVNTPAWPRLINRSPADSTPTTIAATAVAPFFVTLRSCLENGKTSSRDIEKIIRVVAV